MAISEICGNTFHFGAYNMPVLGDLHIVLIFNKIDHLLLPKTEASVDIHE